MEKIVNRWKSERNNTKKTKTLFKQVSNLGNQKHKLAEATHNEVFEEVNCLKCANCCKSIPPIVSQRDIKRISSHLNLSKTTFSDKYLITDNDGDTVINASPCPFLMEDNACSIYEQRPSACRLYPHSGEEQFFKNLNLHKTNIQYCPALFEIIKRLGSL